MESRPTGREASGFSPPCFVRSFLEKNLIFLIKK
jgi:hypothetical protein